LISGGLKSRDWWSQCGVSSGGFQVAGVRLLGRGPCSIAFALDEAGVGMMEQPVEERGGQRCIVVEDLRPMLVSAIGAYEDGAAFITLGDDLEQQVGAELVGSGRLPSIVDDE